jgi:hypothetical protein
MISSTVRSETTLHHSMIRRPPLGLLFLEGRAVLEFAALLPAYPPLRRAPRGDGDPVLVARVAATHE